MALFVLGVILLFLSKVLFVVELLLLLLVVLILPFVESFLPDVVDVTLFVFSFLFENSFLLLVSMGLIGNTAFLIAFFIVFLSSEKF
jgi:hypothetical protein